MKKVKILVGIILISILLFLCAFPPSFISDISHIGKAPCGEIPSGKCSVFKPYYCDDGTLIKNPSVCGCGANHIVMDNECVFVCNDGTIFNECSQKNISYICTNIGLKYAPEKCGCPSHMYYDENIADCAYKTCDDGTKYNHCSSEKPLYCEDGILINNSKECGCPNNFVAENNICVPICSDGTKYNICSTNKPFFCENGTLIQKASKCGCPIDYTNVDDKCVLIYEMYPKQNKFYYVNNYNRESISLIVYGGLNDYLSNLPRSIMYTGTPPTTKDFVLRNIDDEIQKKYLDELVNEIKQKSSNKNEQARIAIRLVQNIPYDYDGLYYGTLNRKYAYEVLYTNTGVCGEKSELLAYLLRELGFGVVLFDFKLENHMSVGIKCEGSYDYLNTGYCFIESTAPSMITYSTSEYIGVGKLKSSPEIIYISDGLSLDVSEEYKDTVTYEEIIGMGPVLDRYYYDKWRSLVNKYGLRTS